MPKTNRRKATLLVLAVSAVLAGLIVFRVFTSEVTYGAIMTENPEMDPLGETEGEILILTVIRRRPWLPHELLGIGRPAHFDYGGLVTRASDAESRTRGSRGDMERSLDNAWSVANAILGMPVHGVRWVSLDFVPDDSAAARIGLRTGDRIMAFNERDGLLTGVDLWRDEELMHVSVTEAITAEELRAGTAHNWYVRLPDGRPAMVQSNHSFGTSAGVSHVLEYIDALTEDDLTAGMRIAATGAVDPRGNVIGVGGVEYKTQAAIRAGADVLFVPRGNIGTAYAVGTGQIEIVPIDTITDVLAWLCLKESLPACDAML